MRLGLQKRIASKVLKTGKGKIWIDPNSLADVKEAITKEDIRELVREGFVKSKRKKGVSRGRFRKKLIQKRKGLRKGAGSKKGKRSSKRAGKKVWVAKVRGLRKILAENKSPLGGEYQKLRKAVKAGVFKNKKQLFVKLEEILKAKSESAGGAGRLGRAGKTVKKTKKMLSDTCVSVA